MAENDDWRSGRQEPGDEERRDPWLRTLATRLRAHYVVAADGTATATPPDAARRSDGLRRRLHELREVTGDRSARYRIVEMIERGGMGHVLLARDEALGRMVAIKRAAAGDRDREHGRNDAVTERQQLRLLREAAIVGRLQHPGVVPIHDLAIDGAGGPFFAMPRIDGRTFAAVLTDARDPAAPADRRWPLARIVEVLRRVCETMAYAHSHGVVHRDLKPANVMIGAYGEVYVVDWGLARDLNAAAAGAMEIDVGDDATPDLVPVGDAAADLTMTGTVLGTPAYMAPERADGTVTGDVAGATRADVYAIGAMLYEVLAGAPPYADERARWTIHEFLTAVRTRAPLPLVEVAKQADPELVAVCERAMHRDPTRRYSDMQALAADLRAWAEHRIVEARGGGVGVRLAKWVRRNRALAATIATAAALLLGSSVWFVVHLAAARDDARISAAAAEQNLREILDLSVVQRVRELRRRADEDLWPANAEHLPGLRVWLQETETLRSVRDRLQRHRTDLATADPADRSAPPPTAPTPVVNDRAVERAEAVWRAQLLDEAIAALDAFFAPLPASVGTLSLDSTVAAVRARLQAAERAAVDAAAEPVRQRWQEAAALVAASPRYGALPFAPQDGLVPIGPDPRTGLMEFAHLATGTPAVRGADGELHLQPENGVVLVLLPGGEFWMGAASGDEHNDDPLAEAINEGPVQRVTLAPFLMSKFEMTQAQWLRATGDNPSVHTARSDYVVDDEAPLHPVESMTWDVARHTLRKLGLQLPTEAQWEYAARAGTSTPWWAGRTVADLLAPPAGNLADATSARALGAQGWAPTPGLDDGYVMHAPVGRFRPNAFGLFDVLGNVWEWCDDEYVSYAMPPAPGTGGRRRSEHPDTVMYRGGAFDQPAQEARSANRAGGPPDRRHFSNGVRPARRWQ